MEPKRQVNVCRLSDIVIPIENEMSFGESAEGGLHKYAIPVLIEQEKDAWRKMAVKKQGGK